MRSRCSRPKPCRRCAVKLLAMGRRGLTSGRHSHSRRVGRPAGHEQAVAVVHLGAEVAGRGWFSPCWYMLVSGARPSIATGARPLEARARRNRRCCTSTTVAVAGPEDEAQGAGGARAVQQRVDRQRGGVGGRSLDPEGLEARELLAGRAAHGVDGQAARRQAVLLAAAQRAEVAGAQEDDQLVLVGRVVQRVVHAKAGVAEARPNSLRLKRWRPKSQARRVVSQHTRAALVHFVNLHRQHVAAAEVEELQLEGQALLAPDGLFGPVADVAQAVVVQRLQLGRQGRRRRLP